MLDNYSTKMSTRALRRMQEAANADPLAAAAEGDAADESEENEQTETVAANKFDFVSSVCQ